MSAGCAIPNGSDPRGYVAPTAEVLKARLAACTPDVYPETVMNADQKKSVASLMNDSRVQRKVFSSLYYPHKERSGFETYFGLDFKDARYHFCYQENGLLGPIYPIEYYEAWYKGLPYQIPNIYKDANVYRDQLRRCVGSPARRVAKRAHHHDYSLDPQTCSWETGYGIMSPLVTAKVTEWLQLQQPVFVESEAQAICARVPDVSFLEPIQSFVTIATVQCSFQ